MFMTLGDSRVSMLSQPWLFGFEYGRPEDAETNMDEDHRPEANAYRHPQRWGAPRIRFVRAHDMHSLVRAFESVTRNNY